MVAVMNGNVVEAIDFTTFNLGSYGTHVVGRTIVPSTTGLTSDEYFDRLNQLVENIADQEPEEFSGLPSHEIGKVSLHVEFDGHKRSFSTPDGFYEEFNVVVGKLLGILKSV